MLVLKRARQDVSWAVSKNKEVKVLMVEENKLVRKLHQDGAHSVLCCLLLNAPPSTEEEELSLVSLSQK